VRSTLPGSNPALAEWASSTPDKPDGLIRWGRLLAAALAVAAVAGLLALIWPYALERSVALILVVSLGARQVLPARGALARIASVATALGVALAALLLWLLAWRSALVRLLVAAALLGVLALRRRERRDPEGSAQRSRTILRAVWETEDFSLTNHMIGVTRVKPGRFRMALLRLSLFAVGLAHRLIFNRGELGGIPSIHFARWVIRKQSRDLIFFSNFDGSWEGYLGDFIDKASVGLNAIWSNTETYPRARLLIFGGARDEPRFKAFGRNSMVPTRVWLAAYPNLSVQQIGANARIRADLFAPLSESEAQAWLSLL
jgi:hypothetical protein